MSVVYITIPGDDKRAFGNALHQAVADGVELVIIQKHKNRSLVGGLIRLSRTVGWRHVPREAWYALLLRFSGKTRRALGYFRTHSAPVVPEAYAPKVLEVDSVNSDEVYQVLCKISPDLLVVWGSAILAPRILATATRAINLHLGYCPYYRGALANQCAVLDNDLSKIGATIHFVNGRADAGDVIETMPADISRPPRELFRDLNDRARRRFLEVAVALASGRNVSATPQDMEQGKTLLLKHWKPSVRFMLGQRIQRWEEEAARAQGPA